MCWRSALISPGRDDVPAPADGGRMVAAQEGKRPLIRLAFHGSESRPEHSCAWTAAGAGIGWPTERMFVHDRGVYLAGVPVRDELVLELARLVDDPALAVRLSRTPTDAWSACWR